MTDQGSKCPVDHAGREAWMSEAAKKRNQAPTPPPATCPVASTGGCSSESLETQPPAQQQVADGGGGLRRERMISSIPRKDVNNNWIYPSEEMFFNAMKRKNWAASPNDMKSIVPIHNAVNEQAWTKILKWEKGAGENECGDEPRLVSFSGDSKKLTPRARFNGLVGYQIPFDRHDWVVDRCGRRIEYVIDFYSGKSNPKNPNIPSFYLDVRPKLNTWEGFRMRIANFFGL